MDGTQFEFSFAPIPDPTIAQQLEAQQQIVAFEMAGQLWSQYLDDDVTINIHVEVTNLLPDNVIGGALPGMKKDVKYDKLYKQLSEDITTGNDWDAVDSLLGSKEFSAIVNGQNIDKLKSMKLTNANSKALDLINGDKDKLDGYILMSDLSGQSNVRWDYDASRKSNIGNDKLDFLSVAVHEVGHILGFTSGLDDGEWLNVVTEARDKGKAAKGDEMKFITPLDIFRYSGNGQNELSIGEASYFSLDGGQTNLANFSTGEYQEFDGDGYQASHWKHNGEDVLGIMDPVLKLGVRRDISSLDTIAMDVTGWDVVNPSQLNWQKMYSNAVESANDARVANRDKDIEKMIKDSNNYKGRRSDRTYSRQLGFWQNIKFQTLDNVEIEVLPTIVKSEVFVIDNSANLISTQAFTGSTSKALNINYESPTITTTDAVTLKIDYQAVVSQTSDTDLFKMGRLTSENIEDLLSLL